MADAVWAPLLSFGLSAAGVWITLVHSRRAGVVDVPNHRSSHTVPTPRGGGIGIVAAVLIVTFYALRSVAGVPYFPIALVAGCLLCLALVGWLDDTRSMAVAVRLPVHVACGFAVAVLVNAVRPLPDAANILWLACWTFWTAASINIANFMDGVDGMIAVQGIIYGVFLFSLVPVEDPASAYGLVLAAACLGFLVWNWPPAKVFLGDVGSGSLGLLFVAGGALALRGVGAALVFLPLFPLYLDALITLIRRYRKGEKLTEAHRSHLYQRFANEGAGHALSTLAYGLAAAIGALAAVSIRDAETRTLGVTIVTYVAATVLAWVLLDKRLLRSRRQA